MSQTEVHHNSGRWRFGDHEVPACEVSRKERRGSCAFWRVNHAHDKDRDDPISGCISRPHPSDNNDRLEMPELNQSHVRAQGVNSAVVTWRAYICMASSMLADESILKLDWKGSILVWWLMLNARFAMNNLMSWKWVSEWVVSALTSCCYRLLGYHVIISRICL